MSCGCAGCGEWRAYLGSRLPDGPGFRQYEVLTADLVAALAACLRCDLPQPLPPPVLPPAPTPPSPPRPITALSLATPTQAPVSVPASTFALTPHVQKAYLSQALLTAALWEASSHFYVPAPPQAACWPCGMPRPAL